MQELVLAKQQLETEQESLAEADEAVKVAEGKLAANDVSTLHHMMSLGHSLNVEFYQCKLNLAIHTYVYLLHTDLALYLIRIKAMMMQ